MKFVMSLKSLGPVAESNPDAGLLTQQALTLALAHNATVTAVVIVTSCCHCY